MLTVPQGPVLPGSRSSARVSHSQGGCLRPSLRPVGGLAGVPRFAHRNALSRAAEVQINALLEAEKIERRAVYRPGEVCRLLHISSTTLRQLCELAEQPDNPCRPPQSLESFRIGCPPHRAYNAGELAGAESEHGAGELEAGLPGFWRFNRCGAWS